MLKTKEEIAKRIKVLEVEVIMGNYYDGWTLRGMKKELAILRDRLDRIENRNE